MLVLSRRKGEEVVIGNSIIVTVVRVKGNRVQLGIQAPPDVRIRRAEAKPHYIDLDCEPVLQSDCCCE